MGRAKKVLDKLEEKTRKNIAMSAKKQLTGKAVDTGMTATASVIDTNSAMLIQPGTVIQGVGVVADVDVMHDGQYAQVKYTVYGTDTTHGSMHYASSGEVVGVSGIGSTINNEGNMRVHIKGILQGYMHTQSSHVQRMIDDNNYDITSLVDALVSCESTLQSVYALTQIAAAMDDVDYHRFINSLRTMMIDESGVEPNAQPWLTPLDESDGRGSYIGDGLLGTHEKNGSTDHIDGLNRRIVCGVCTAINMASNSHCGKCGNQLRQSPVQYAQEMYGTFIGPQQSLRCVRCGTNLWDEAECPACHLPRDVVETRDCVRCWRCGEVNKAFDLKGCNKCGAPLYERLNNQYVRKKGNVSPIYNMVGSMTGGLLIHCMQCHEPNEMDADACVKCGGKVGIDCRQCGQQNSVEWKTCVHCSGILQLPVKLQIHPVLCLGCNKYYMSDRDICPGCQTPRDSSGTHPTVRCMACGHYQTYGWDRCLHCGKSAPIDVMTEDADRLIVNRIVKP